MKFSALIFPAALSLSLLSCSEKATKDASSQQQTSNEAGHKEPIGSGTGENDAQESRDDSETAPDTDAIGEDCVAFLRATRAVPAERANGDCVGCSTNDDPEVLKFRTFRVGEISTSEGGCNVEVKIHAQFNPSKGGMIAGGLVAWISPEQRKQYAAGVTPEGEQIYDVTVTYSRTQGVWRAVEFDRTK